MATAAELAAGTATDGRVAVTLEAGRSYRIAVRGEGHGDATLWAHWIRGGIHDEDGQFMQGTGFSASGNNNRVTVRASESGTYYVVAGSHGHVDVVGVYTVHVAEFDSDSVRAGARNLGDITEQSCKALVRDAVNYGDDWEDYFSFTLSEAKVVKLRLLKQDANADLYLEDERGLYRSSSRRDGTKNEEIEEALPAGTYYVHVVAQKAGENSYTLRYQVADPEPDTWFFSYAEDAL